MQIKVSHLVDLTDNGAQDVISAFSERTHMKSLAEILKEIEALCTNPYWTSERRWKIAELAAQGRRIVATQARLLLEQKDEHKG